MAKGTTPKISWSAVACLGASGLILTVDYADDQDDVSSFGRREDDEMSEM